MYKCLSEPVKKSPWAISKALAGQKWPAGPALATPGLDQRGERTDFECIRRSGSQPVVRVPLMVREQPVGGTQKPYV
jgi:hypothetical protein